MNDHAALPFPSSHFEWLVVAFYADGTTTRTTPTTIRAQALEVHAMCLADSNCVQAHVVRRYVAEELEAL